MVRALAIIATANDRLIHSAGLNVNGGNVNPAVNTVGLNQFHHEGAVDYDENEDVPLIQLIKYGLNQLFEGVDY